MAAQQNEIIQQRIIFLERLQKDVKNNRNGGTVLWEDDMPKITDIISYLNDYIKMRNEHLPKMKGDHDS